MPSRKRHYLEMHHLDEMSQAVCRHEYILEGASAGWVACNRLFGLLMQHGQR
jgi:hypothetical protein